MKKRIRYWVNRLDKQFVIKNDSIFGRYSIISNKKFKLRDKNQLIYKLKLIEITADESFYLSKKIWKEIFIDD